MLIKARMGMSADGFVATAEGVPTLALMPGFIPASHGYPEFIEGVDAVVMGRNTFVPALGSPDWPWPGLAVYVLTSSPLPAGPPGDVIAERRGAAALAARLRSRPSGRDIHLVGGPRTIRAFHEIGELDRLEIVLLPVLLGSGRPLSPPGAPAMPLRLLRSDRVFPDGSTELVYTPKPAEAAG
ncbi:MAG TPA: dihydrofolate reductase family protein [Streptosporangiaceae bacterium]|nr:dihydrofolate reductase family protein [Streptosporangiaceae bacterium]